MLHTDGRNAVIVAIDHGMHLGVLDRFDDPEAVLSNILAAEPDGILAGVAFLRAFEDVLASYPELTITATVDHVHESTLPGRDEGAEIQQQIFTAEEAAAVGADAIKTVLIYGREDKTVLRDNLQYVTDVTREARKHGISSVVEPTLWGQRIEDELDSDMLEHATRIAWEIGADIIKSPYPGTNETFEPIARHSPVPVYIAGGPPMDTDREVLEMVTGAMDAGARGVMFGRNVWQRDDPAAIIDAISSVVNEGKPVAEIVPELA